jgi:adenylate kinase
MRTYIVLLGAPGAGKGTQAKLLSEKLNYPHISTGDLFRENLKNQTELGKKAQVYMNAGQLVPDDVTIEMVKERIANPDCANGAILDGFPRTTAQAEAFDSMLFDAFQASVTCVPCIEVDAEKLIERLSARWVCPDGHVFHAIFNPEKEKGICDICGKGLYQRDDDKVETVKKRLEVYQTQTAPLIAYYQEQGILRSIDGDQTIEQVGADILRVIDDAMSKSCGGRSRE